MLRFYKKVDDNSCKQLKPFVDIVYIINEKQSDYHQMMFVSVFFYIHSNSSEWETNAFFYGSVPATAGAGTIMLTGCPLAQRICVHTSIRAILVNLISLKRLMWFSSNFAKTKPLCLDFGGQCSSSLWNHVCQTCECEKTWIRATDNWVWAEERRLLAVLRLAVCSPWRPHSPADSKETLLPCLCRGKAMSINTFCIYYTL